MVCRVNKSRGKDVCSNTNEPNDTTLSERNGTKSMLYSSVHELQTGQGRLLLEEVLTARLPLGKFWIVL